MNNAILQPVFALAGWTGLVLLMIPLRRVGAARRRELRIDDFKYGESSAVPAHVSIPNRNYMNLLELPLLFYVACLMLFAAQTATAALVTTAWLYVALRIVHSLIHLSYNKVLHRFAVFVLSNVVLVLLWLQAGWALF
ncbi:MAPEG family protein [Paucibacter sp. APW11]|uniref:MAPEG family protein n=1 Tax=Roseateles aquae TaxID=3077235 RepID=A0ABU3PIN6_9BURK|nr:MAPEG family protein [Paucibacter sp. APW11]MDT9002300.1 MAPEG family protein [Paucibacter sp. APW11]